MPRVELIYDRDCPNVVRARAELLRAFADANLEPEWKEWRREDPKTPERVRIYGSPTILVDREDVGGGVSDAQGPSCRIYAGREGGPQGVPRFEDIVKALRAGSHTAASGVEAMNEWVGDDLTASRIKWVLWGFPIALIIVGGVLTESIRPWLWAPAFLVAGIACVANGRRCHRAHCYITGPLYLVAAVVVILQGFDVTSMDWLWISVGAVVGTALAYQIEWVRGRHRWTAE